MHSAIHRHTNLSAATLARPAESAAPSTRAWKLSRSPSGDVKWRVAYGARPAGPARGAPAQGFGRVEPSCGSQPQNFRNMLQAVSDVVLRNVASVFPYEPTQAHRVDLCVSREFAHTMDGLPTDVFVEQLIKPVRAITEPDRKHPCLDHLVGKVRHCAVRVRSSGCLLFHVRRTLSFRL